MKTLSKHIQESFNEDKTDNKDAVKENEQLEEKVREQSIPKADNSILDMAISKRESIF